ncbi:hypothetical protein T4B_12001 [Trichinella pseudospiralis]|uniref:Uncharacterized protein n=1 Tax=Trichinella pseudospiralis TaxID=6337 RepID=A0A0V0Y6W2_TRIPS|nr:hypothetical protein T4E_717 [Trichinella pseudospiralis]KRZ23935.1 hypothetical protein T4B_12001 [Trichinella pseudospiralis]
MDEHYFFLFNIDKECENYENYHLIKIYDCKVEFGPVGKICRLQMILTFNGWKLNRPLNALSKQK